VGRWDGSADLAQYGVSFLLYGLLDYLVDGHFRAVELLDQAIEETEDALFDARREAIDLVQRRSFQLRKSLVVLRRITLPTREVLNTLLRHDLDYVREPMAEYFRLRQDVWADRHSRLVRGNGYRAFRPFPAQRLALRDLHLCMLRRGRRATPGAQTYMNLR
jgi:Mg2+ and Co2+ transporter CorA